jgi:hypothetical protein
VLRPFRGPDCFEALSFSRSVSSRDHCVRTRQGFENYLKKQNPTTQGQRSQKRKFKEEERLFSRSSVTAPNSTWSLEGDADAGPPSKKGGRGRGGRQKRGTSHKRKGNDYVYSSDSEYEGY